MLSASVEYWISHAVASPFSVQLSFTLFAVISVAVSSVGFEHVIAACAVVAIAKSASIVVKILVFIVSLFLGVFKLHQSQTLRNSGA